MRGRGLAILTKEADWFVTNGSTIALCHSVPNSSCGSVSPSNRPQWSYGLWKVVIIILLTSSISFITVLGNTMVLLSIKVNRHLQTVNNYFLFSLACADLLIGLFSMNLYIVYMVKGYWPLGPLLCDFWLVVDYVVSNASVMNLLLISFDRYFCVTRPLSYPAKRTAKRAGLMIAAAWLLSLALWAPAILVWQGGPAGRAIPKGHCYILLLSSPAMTLATAIPAFYLPVVVMTVLYVRISLASQGRLKTNSDNTIKPCCLRSASPASSIGQTETTQGTGELDQYSSGKAQERPPPTGSIRKDVAESSGSVISWKNAEMDNDLLNACISEATKDLSEGVSQPRAAAPFIISFRNTPTTVTPTISVSQLRRDRRCARERRVTRTILAVLLVFILTWTPHNVMVVIGTFCHRCVPDVAWTLGYWLCYINSTVNPACYALCNATFRKTFKQLIMCRFKKHTPK